MPRCVPTATSYATDTQGRETSAAGMDPSHVAWSVRYHCATHNMPISEPQTTDGPSPLCPLGTIEEATERTLKPLGEIKRRLVVLERIALVLSKGGQLTISLDDNENLVIEDESYPNMRQPK